MSIDRSTDSIIGEAVLKQTKKLGRVEGTENKKNDNFFEPLKNVWENFFEAIVLWVFIIAVSLLPVFFKIFDPSNVLISVWNTMKSNAAAFSYAASVVIVAAQLAFALKSNTKEMKKTFKNFLIVLVLGIFILYIFGFAFIAFYVDVTIHWGYIAICFIAFVVSQILLKAVFDNNCS